MTITITPSDTPKDHNVVFWGVVFLWRGFYNKQDWSVIISPIPSFSNLEFLLYHHSYSECWLNCHHCKLLISRMRFVCFRFCLLCSKVESVERYYDAIHSSRNLETTCCTNCHSCWKRQSEDFPVFGYQSKDRFIYLLMKTKYSGHIMVFGVDTRGGNVMPPFIFLHGLKLNTDTYMKGLEEVKLEIHFLARQDTQNNSQDCNPPWLLCLECSWEWDQQNFEQHQGRTEGKDNDSIKQFKLEKHQKYLQEILKSSWGRR